MDTSSIKSQIDAFRALSTEAAITPETLGTLLQSMTDAIGTAALQTDLDDVTAGVKAVTNTCNINIAALQNWRTDISASPNIVQSLRLGTVNKVSVGISATLKSLTTGGNTSVANAIALPAATADTAGVMTAAQVQRLNAYYDHVCEADKSLNDVSAKVPTSLAYTSGTRVLSAKNNEGSLLMSVTLPLATSSTPGLTTTKAVTDVQNTLDTRVKELGNFGSEEAALNALREPKISGNSQIVVVHLTYQTHMGITMMQNVENDYCRQIIFNHSHVYQRAIYFTSSKRDTINYAEDWSCLFADRLIWDSGAHKYVPSHFGTKFKASYTDAIPLASTTTDGLMSKEDKAKLAQLENKLNALLGVQS